MSDSLRPGIICRYWIGYLVLVTTWVFATPGLASIDLSWFSVDGGGGTSSGPSLQLSGTAGQPDAGVLISATYRLEGGFRGGGSVVTGLPEVNPEVPGLSFRLHAVVPNPVNPLTKIRFDLPAAARTRLRLYNVRGELVSVLVDGDLGAGPHAMQWTGYDDHGVSIASGVYILVLESDGHETRQKITLVR
jgi:hypothetical protein